MVPRLGWSASGGTLTVSSYLTLAMLSRYRKEGAPRRDVSAHAGPHGGVRAYVFLTHERDVVIHTDRIDAMLKPDGDPLYRKFKPVA